MGKLKFLAVLGLCVGALVGVGFYQKAMAACTTDPVGHCSGTGYFDSRNGPRYQDLGQVIQNGLTSNGSEYPTKGDITQVSFNGDGTVNKGSFISFIKNNIARGGRDATGAQFIVQLMRGGSDFSRPSAAVIQDFEDRINSSDIQIVYSDSQDWGSWNSGYMKTSGDDDAFINESGSSSALVFRSKSSGAVYAKLKVSCANPLDRLPGLPPATWTLSGNTTSNAQFAKPGDTVVFTNRIKNNGPGAASYQYNYQGSNNNGTYVDKLALSTATNVPAGDYAPLNSNYSYLIPTNAKQGETFCMRMSYTNPRGPGTVPYGEGTEDCVTVVTTTIPKTWSISGVTTASVASATPGTVVSFTHKITNSAASTSPASICVRAGWNYTGLPLNSLWPEDATCQSRTISQGASTAPDSNPRYLTIPDGPDGTQFCQRTTYTQATGPGTRYGTGSQGCVTRVNPPPQKPIGSFTIGCSSISGYAYDPDYPTAPLLVQVIVNGDKTNLTAGSSFYSSVQNLNKFSLFTANSVQVIAVGVNTKGVADGYDKDLGSISLAPCYASSCGGASPATTAAIRATTSINPEAKFGNTGTESWDSGGRVTARSSGTAGNYANAPVGVPSTASGSSATINFGAFTVPATLAAQTITMELVLDGATVFGTCTTAFDPYTSFTLTPFANNVKLNPDPENPTNFDFASRLDIVYVEVPNPAPASVTGLYASSQIVRKNGVIIYNNSSSPPALSGNSYIYSYTNIPTPAPNKLGDQYCGTIDVNFTSGWINRNNSIINKGAAGTSNPAACDLIVNRPYFKVYGGDIVAGGSFKDATTGTCTTAPGQGNLIGQYRLGSGPPSNGNGGPGTGGAGTQFAAIAVLKVSGVASAMLRFSVPTSVSGLTFANTTANLPADKFGGDFGAPGYCAPNYFDDEQFKDARISSSSTSAINVSNIITDVPTGKQTKIKPALGVLTITAPLPVNTRHTLFVDGNVSINSNIAYAPLIASNNPDDLPYLTIIAKGDILIDPSVTRIDGLYIAQSGGASNPGHIYTCAGLASATIPLGCSAKLTVNGAFIANRVVMQRTNGTLRDSPREREPSTSANIAELFQFAPEMYIGRPIFKERSAPYDSIKGLPPVL